MCVCQRGVGREGKCCRIYDRAINIHNTLGHAPCITLFFFYSVIPGKCIGNFQFCSNILTNYQYVQKLMKIINLHPTYTLLIWRHMSSNMVLKCLALRLARPLIP